MIKTELYFGRRIELMDNEFALVKLDAWKKFKIAEVDSRIDGYTELFANGSWRGTIEEAFVLVIIWDEADVSRAISSKIDKIRCAYCRAFGQESVMRIDHDVYVSF